jgi:hypothetical protein
VSTLLCTCVAYVENCISPFRLIARVYTGSRISSSRLLSWVMIVQIKLKKQMIIGLFIRLSRKAKQNSLMMHASFAAVFLIAREHRQIQEKLFVLGVS